MKHIRKGTEPTSLTRHRAREHSDYDNYKEKDDLRKALLNEQKAICCYCMQRIKKDKMKIEHWKPQKSYPELQLNYNNLLGACLGNEGKPKHLQHCDTKKGDELITINPTHHTCEILIKFSKFGEIYSDDDNINKDLNETLNLNRQTLIKNRKSVLDMAMNDFSNRHTGTWTKEILEREIERWEREQPYKVYCQIVIFFLKKKLSKFSHI